MDIIDLYSRKYKSWHTTANAVREGKRYNEFIGKIYTK